MTAIVPKEQIDQTTVGTHKATGQMEPRMVLKKDLPMT